MDVYGRLVGHGTDTTIARLDDTDDPRQLRQSKSERIQYLTLDEIEAVPKTVQDVYDSQFKNVCMDAMNKEVEGLKRNRVETYQHLDGRRCTAGGRKSG